MTTAQDVVDRAPRPVTVRYWAGARAAAGTDHEQLLGTSVGEVLGAAVAAHPLLAPVLAVATFLLDGRAVGADEPLTDHAAPADRVADVVLEVLPPFAGG